MALAATKCVCLGPSSKSMAGSAQTNHTSAKTKPRTSPSRDGLKLETSVLERIFREGGGVGDFLQPVKPRSPGRFGEGKPVKVAYQGLRGSYCQEAAARAFQRCDAVPFGDEMAAAFEAADDGDVARAVVPAENSVDGAIHRNYDLLLRHRGLHIVGEVLLPVNHCLLALPGTDVNGVKRLVSHPQALAHCSRRIAAFGGDVEVEAVENAAAAARLVAENGVRDTAVIGSRTAAGEFGLRVVEDNIQDYDDNYTRFLVLGKDSVVPGGDRPAKTTVAFSVATSKLYRALSIFALRNINVLKMESRPRREDPVRVEGSVKYFKYIFVVDLEGSVADFAMEKALDQLNQIATDMRVLGSYAMDL